MAVKGRAAPVSGSDQESESQISGTLCGLARNYCGISMIIPSTYAFCLKRNFASVDPYTPTAETYTLWEFMKNERA